MIDADTVKVFQYSADIKIRHYGKTHGIAFILTYFAGECRKK
jgi:hypothetical protein